jgi:putative ABC transport system permease protein
MTAVVWLPEQSYPSGKERSVFYRAVLDRLKQTSGVTAAIANPIPFSGDYESDVFQIEGRAAGPGEPLPFGNMEVVTPDYFRALGIPLKRGRTFTDHDGAGNEPVAVIDENLARRYWPGEDPVGKRIVRKGQRRRIVGVVGHVTDLDLAADSGKGVYYFPLFQDTLEGAWIVAKTPGVVNEMPAAIRQAVHEADPRQAVHTFRGMEDLVAQSLAPRRFGMRLLAFFGITALFLAALGLYGVISYSVAQRRREIGIRIALGAEPRGVVGLVVGRGLRLAALGALIGIVGSVAVARLLESQLFGVSPFDPLTIAAMAAILLAVSTLASYLPARRAMRVDPAVALRPE